jgi:hypothetical protein
LFIRSGIHAGTEAYDERLAEAQKASGWLAMGARIVGSLATGEPSRNVVVPVSYWPLVGTPRFWRGQEASCWERNG